MPGLHPLERKKTCAERPLGLLELAPGFVDENLCERAHVIFVVSGALDLQLDERVEHIGQGEACFVDAGTRHRAANSGEETALVFIASGLQVAP